MRDPRLLLFSARGYANETLREQEVGDLGDITSKLSLLLGNWRQDGYKTGIRAA
jgi:hypothetical protein